MVLVSSSGRPVSLGRTSVSFVVEDEEEEDEARLRRCARGILVCCLQQHEQAGTRECDAMCVGCFS